MKFSKLTRGPTAIGDDIISSTTNCIFNYFEIGGARDTFIMYFLHNGFLGFKVSVTVRGVGMFMRLFEKNL